jgi:starch-binding outer membrane protein, SusD/RagB family
MWAFKITTTMSIRNLYKKGSSLVFLSVFAFGIFSCQTDLLDPVPQTQIIDQFAFDTPERISLQVNNLYTAVKNGQFLGGRYQVYGEIRANDFLNRTTNGVTGLLVWNQTVTETSQNDVISLWNTAYAAINQINVFLQGLDDNEAKFIAPVFAADYTTTLVPRFKAEARLLRALSYHCLVQLYAKPYTLGNPTGSPGLPLRLQAETSLANNDLARSSVAEVYSQILADLDFAEQNLPLTYGASASLLNVTRAHRNTAIALKTRVYLTMGDYDSVIEEANKIVSEDGPFTAATGVPHALQASVASVFASPQETTESILSFPFTAQNAPGTQNQLGFYYRSSASTSTNPGGGEYGLNQLGIMAPSSAWPDTDARRTFIYKVGTEYYWGKYPSGTPFLDKAPVIRYAEVLLNLSEAIARTTAGVDERALELLNAVRQRSDNTVSLAPADNTELLDALKLERRIEFLGEGLRSMDILRLNEEFPAKGSVGAVPSTALNYIWPIPSNELAANKLMTRNE